MSLISRRDGKLDIPVWALCVLVVATIAGEIAAIYCKNGGAFYFPIDDVYINLGLARRFFAGVANGEYPSGTSAFGWSFVFGLLSILLSKPMMVAAALCFNTIASIFLIVILAKFLNGYDRPWIRAGFLVFAVLLINPPELALLGMEHIIHVTFCAAALLSLKRYFETSKAREADLMCLFVFLAAMCRQETWFLAAAIGVFLLARRAFLPAAGVGCAAFLPALVQGIVQLGQGKSFWSSPIALKTAAAQDWHERFLRPLINLKVSHLPVNVIFIFIVIIVMAAVFLNRSERTRADTATATAQDFLGIAFLYALFHIMFASTGWMARYEAPIDVIGMVAIATGLPLLLPKLPDAGVKREITIRQVVLLAAAVLVLFWIGRGTQRTYYLLKEPQLSWEVHNHVCRDKDLVSMAPPTEYVVLYDVGCTTFYTDNPVIDLWGLTSYETRMMGKRNGQVMGGGTGMNKQELAQVTKSHGAKMAIIYKPEFADKIPDNWVEIGHWGFDKNTIYVNNPVTIFATDGRYAKEVRHRFNDYQKSVGNVPGITFENAK